MLPKRLSSRLKFLTVLWLIVAVASIVLTLVLSWRLEGGWKAARRPSTTQAACGCRPTA